MDELIERMRKKLGSARPQYMVSVLPADLEDLLGEIERLRERLGPRGLKVVMIDGTGHYVSAAIAAKLREAVEIIKELCSAYESMRVYCDEPPNRSPSINAGLAFLATMEKQEDSTSER